jgi:hypothetical protein
MHNSVNAEFPSPFRQSSLIHILLVDGSQSERNRSDCIHSGCVRQGEKVTKSCLSWLEFSGEALASTDDSSRLKWK